MLLTSAKDLFLPLELLDYFWTVISDCFLQA